MDDTIAARTRLLQRSRRFAYPIPDALLAVVLAAAALNLLPPGMRDELVFVLIVEGGFLLMQGTLVDIATRLKKRPPIWLIPIIVIGVAIFSEHAMAVLKLAWQRGSVVFLPLVISLAERGIMLWNMPNRSRIEKIAARALIANRITTGLALFGLMTITMLLGVVFTDRFDSWTAGAWPPLAAGAIYFAVAAYDDWRVRGKKFAENPRVLFRWDPISINYLEPV